MFWRRLLGFILDNLLYHIELIKVNRNTSNIQTFPVWVHLGNLSCELMDFLCIVTVVHHRYPGTWFQHGKFCVDLGNGIFR